jgi:hypothetical protein
MKLQKSSGGLWLQKCFDKKDCSDFDALEMGIADYKLDCHEDDADMDMILSLVSESWFFGTLFLTLPQ